MRANSDWSARAYDELKVNKSPTKHIKVHENNPNGTDQKPEAQIELQMKSHSGMIRTFRRNINISCTLSEQIVNYFKMQQHHWSVGLKLMTFLLVCEEALVKDIAKGCNERVLFWFSNIISCSQSDNFHLIQVQLYFHFINNADDVLVPILDSVFLCLCGRCQKRVRKKKKRRFKTRTRLNRKTFLFSCVHRVVHLTRE